MKRAVWSCLVGILSMVAIACSGDSGGIVKGKVTLDGSPLSSAQVTLIGPDSKTDEFGSRSGEDGQFEVMGPGATGLPTGSYKVIVKKLEVKGGKALPMGLDEEQARIMGMTKNIVPAIYEKADKTPLSVIVKGGETPLELTLKKK